MEHMKTLLSLMAFLVTGFAFGADPSITNPPPATINGVSPTKDSRALVVKYDREGKSYELKVAFTNTITDFRYSRWMGDQGIAVVGATANGEFYWTTAHLLGVNTTTPSYKLPAPAGTNQLMGIANTMGDSVIITAINHHRPQPNRPDLLTGWMFIDNCPIPGQPISGFGKVVTFDVNTESAKKK